MGRLFLVIAAALAVVVAVVQLRSMSLEMEDFQDGLDAYNRGSYATALKELHPLAEKGYPNAQIYLGLMYSTGKGVTQDYQQAIYWYRKAAEQGSEIAKDNFASLETKMKVTSSSKLEAENRQYTASPQQKTQTASNMPASKTPIAITARTLPSNRSIALAQETDSAPPSIQIASSITVKVDSPSISGGVTDANKVVLVTVNGVAINFSGNTFTFTRYVPASGTTVQIEAIDEWGNKSQKTVKLTRTITDTSDQIIFANLDPTKINGRDNKKAVALIIGVADYTRAPAAVYADSDASVFGDYARRALGIPRSNIKLLTNGEASRTDLQVAMKRWLRGRIEEGKTDVYVFYAGHGLASPDGEDLYLLPYNGEPSLLDETSIQRSELFDVIAAANPKSATVFLDTCYSGLSRGEETLLASARPILITPKKQSVPKGFTVFSAASGLQISSGLDEAKHGLFSYYLMKGLEGPADSNGDKAITAGELQAYVLKNVRQQAVRLGREQVPELSGDGDRVLVRW